MSRAFDSNSGGHVHCLRHTFATLLARKGVTPGVAQKLMRYSDIRLTMNIYTHLDLADTAEAVAALPGFWLGAEAHAPPDDGVFVTWPSGTATGSPTFWRG